MLENIDEHASSNTYKMFLSLKAKIAFSWKKLKGGYASCRLTKARQAFLYGEINGVGFSLSMICYLMCVEFII